MRSRASSYCSRCSLSSAGTARNRSRCRERCGSNRGWKDRPPQWVVGDGRLRGDGGDAVRDDLRQLLLPAVPHDGMAAAWCSRAGPDGAADPDGGARLDRWARAARLPRRPHRARGRDAAAARARTPRPGCVLRDPDAPLPRRPGQALAERHGLRIDLLHDARRAPCARRLRDAHRPVSRRPTAHGADPLPDRRGPVGRFLLALRERARALRRRYAGVRGAVNTLRRPEFLQWFGLFGAGFVWVAQLVIGFGVNVAACGAAGPGLNIDVDTWQIVLMAVGIPLALLSEAAAIAIFLETRGLHHADPPPWGRRHFFAAAAMLGNVLFIAIILLSGIAAIANA